MVQEIHVEGVKIHRIAVRGYGGGFKHGLEVNHLDWAIRNYGLGISVASSDVGIRCLGQDQDVGFRNQKLMVRFKIQGLGIRLWVNDGDLDLRLLS